MLHVLETSDFTNIPRWQRKPHCRVKLDWPHNSADSRSAFCTIEFDPHSHIKLFDNKTFVLGDIK